MSQSSQLSTLNGINKLTLPPAINSTSSSAFYSDGYNALSLKTDTQLPSKTLDIGLSLIEGTSVNFDALDKHSNATRTLLSPHYPMSCIEMIDSERWLRKYGLKANKLTYEHILNLIGFKQPQGFVLFCFFLQTFKLQLKTHIYFKTFFF